MAIVQREILILLSPTNNFGDCRKVQGDRPDSHLALFFFNKIIKRLGVILVLYVELLFERRVKGNSVRIEKTRVGNGRKLGEGIDANSQLVIDPRCQPFTYKDRQRDLFPLVIFFSYVREGRN
jgi:hypothetical protein